MKINHGRARPLGALGTRAKTDGSAIRHYLLLSLFLASCASPDTQHHIVISTRDQKLAVLDRGTLLATYPVSTSKFGFGQPTSSNCTTSLELARRSRSWTRRSSAQFPVWFQVIQWDRKTRRRL